MAAFVALATLAGTVLTVRRAGNSSDKDRAMTVLDKALEWQKERIETLEDQEQARKADIAQVEENSRGRHDQSQKQIATMQREINELRAWKGWGQWVIKAWHVLRHEEQAPPGPDSDYQDSGTPGA